MDMYVYVCICVCVCIYMCMCMCMDMDMYVYVCMCVYIHVHVYVYVYVYMPVDVNVYVYVYMCFICAYMALRKVFIITTLRLYHCMLIFYWWSAPGMYVYDRFIITRPSEAEYICVYACIECRVYSIGLWSALNYFWIYLDG
jgi:hypothetical protein